MGTRPDRGSLTRPPEDRRPPSPGGRGHPSALSRGERAFCLAAAAIVLLCVAPARGQAPAVVRDEACGVDVELPGADWALQDISQGPVTIHIYSPTTPPIPRFTLIRLPRFLVPDGIETRAQAIAGRGVQDLRVEDGSIAGRPARRLTYAGDGVRTVEYGIEQGEHYLIVQLAARETEWGPAFDAVLASVRLATAEPLRPPVLIHPATPEETRAARREAIPVREGFAVVAHRVHVEIEPALHRLASTDLLDVEALADGADEVHLYSTGVEMDEVRIVDGPALPFEAADEQLHIALPAPVARGDRVAISVRAHSEDFTVTMDQTLVAEISVLGQVREESSFSSHVAYYPVDAENDASIHMEITVPDGYVAVSGGVFLGSEDADGRRTFTYELAERRPRLLPMGFAVARYEALRGETPGGLAIEVWAAPDEAVLARQRLEVAERAGALLEERLGPLPWGRVAFCHVRPIQEETGVSLPGLILISDGFFGNIEGVHLRGSNLEDPASLSLLIVADELSHQWNAYSVPLPNELAEGVSTFTNLLFIEREEGPGEYRAGLRFCAGAYRAAVETAQDIPLAHPLLYASTCYRAVAFTKVPVVLDLLRQRLGDEAFFDGLHRAFDGRIRDREAAYDGFRRSFEEASGEDLQPFFDQWFFRAGYPRLEVRWEPAAADGGGPAVRLDIAQVQPGPPFEIAVDVRVDTATGEAATFPLTLVGSHTQATLALPAAPTGVTLDPEGRTLLLEAR